jgi:hypothetical protein
MGDSGELNENTKKNLQHRKGEVFGWQVIGSMFNKI